MPRGHLFIIESNLLSLQCTDRIVSGAREQGDGLLMPSWTWRRQGIHEQGTTAQGEKNGVRLWDEGKQRNGALQPEPNTWVVEVTDVAAFNGIQRLMNRLTECIALIAERHERHPPQWNGQNVSLLIALPFLSTGLGGAAERRDEVLSGLLQALDRAAQTHGAAVVLVFNPAPYLAPLTPSASESESTTAAKPEGLPPTDARDQFTLASYGSSAYSTARALRRQMINSSAASNPILSRLRPFADAGRLAVFIGAGVSLSAGLPSWYGLLESLHQKCVAEGGKPPPWDKLAKLDPLLLAQVLVEYWTGETRAQRTANLHRAAEGMLCANRFSLQHALLVQLTVRDFITLNFDDLLEQASLAAARDMAVIPANDRRGWGRHDAQRRLLKMHGSVSIDGEIKTPKRKLVLTAQDYLRFAESANALGGAVQGLMLSHHLLFVGFGMTDPNFLRIHNNVARMLPDLPQSESRTDAMPEISALEKPIGTALLVENQDWKVDFANRHLDGIWCVRPNVTLVASPENDRILDDARELEILLDHLVTLTDDSVSYASDERLMALLYPGDRDLARAIADLPMPENESPLGREVEALRRRTGLSDERLKLRKSEPLELDDWLPKKPFKS